MPGIEAALPRFRAANTQVLGVSVDSIYSHANWARDLGGISFPLLADFHPKGEIAKQYGLYLEKSGITDRATVVIDADGVVRHASTVGPSGERKIEDLVRVAEEVNQSYGKKLEPAPAARPPERPLTLFVKNSCGFSRTALLAVDNLRIKDKVGVRNVSTQKEALDELKRLTGKETAPCLVVDGKPMHESKEIVQFLVNQCAPL